MPIAGTRSVMVVGASYLYIQRTCPFFPLQCRLRLLYVAPRVGGALGVQSSSPPRRIYLLQSYAYKYIPLVFSLGAQP
jgi:hypothetical protein